MACNSIDNADMQEIENGLASDKPSSFLNSLSWYSCVDSRSALERDPYILDGSAHSFKLLAYEPKI